MGLDSDPALPQDLDPDLSRQIWVSVFAEHQGGAVASLSCTHEPQPLSTQAGRIEQHHQGGRAAACELGGGPACSCRAGPDQHEVAQVHAWQAGGVQPSDGIDDSDGSLRLSVGL